jgi:hypothetical protein
VTMVEGYRSRQANHAQPGHNVGLEVHDVGGLQAATFEPAGSSPSSRSFGSRKSISVSDSKTWC